jgi:hypothetical protein
MDEDKKEIVPFKNQLLFQKYNIKMDETEISKAMTWG